MLVWNGLVEMFGSGVIREYGDTPPRLWAEAISSLNDEDLRRGFSALLKQKRQYAPNLTEFVDACSKKSEPVRYLGVPLDAEGWKRLSPPPIERRACPEKIDSYLAKMRALVGPAIEDARCFGASMRRGHAPCTCQAQGTCNTCVRFARLMDEADQNRGVTA